MADLFLIGVSQPVVLGFLGITQICVCKHIYSNEALENSQRLGWPSDPGKWTLFSSFPLSFSLRAGKYSSHSTSSTGTVVTMTLLFSGGSVSWLSHLKLFNNLCRSCWVVKSQSLFLTYYLPRLSFFAHEQKSLSGSFKVYPSQAWLQWERVWRKYFHH